MKYKKETDTLFDKTLLGLMTFLIISYFVLPLFIQARLEIFIVTVLIVISVAVYAYLQSDRHNERQKKSLQSSIKEIDSMRRIEFKLYVEKLFENMGYKVDITSSAGKYGVDLLLKKDGKFIAVQVIKYEKKVDVSSVQQIFSAKTHYRAHEAWIVTNNTFTNNACNLAKKSGVKLVDRRELINFISET